MLYKYYLFTTEIYTFFPEILYRKRTVANKGPVKF